jgi:hypothetical protein
MREHGGVTTRGVLGACGITARWFVGALTLVLGVACLTNAFVVPSLFGPVTAAVIACERLLCAARSTSARAGGVWSVVALGWVLVAACMLHAPVVSLASLRWLVVLLIAASALCRLWVHVASPRSVSASAGMWLLAIVIPVQLTMLFDGLSAPISRVAAAVAIELALIGVLSPLQAATSGRTTSHPPPRPLREAGDLVTSGFGMEAKIA